MIVITRRLAMRLRKILRQALNLSTRGLSPAILLDGGPHGLYVRSHTSDAAVEFHLEGEQPVEQFWLPFELLADVEGRKESPVQIQVDDGSVLASWRDGCVPQMVRHTLAEPPEEIEFPELPTNAAENPASLRKSLHDAMETTDPEAIRYANNCVQLRGETGEIVATDGRQLLVQNGFTFPWDDEVLVPRTKVFGCRELPQDEPVRIGKVDNWIAFGIGAWRIFRLMNTEGRFPKVTPHIPRSEDANSSLQVSAADAEFLRTSLPRLPADDELNLPLTVDLNGQAAVRAKAEDQIKPTELVLANSTLSGEPMRVNMNRQYLARALALGFHEVYLSSPKTPVLCRDGHRQYVWALLDPESALSPTENAIRIESGNVPEDVQLSNPKSRKRKAAMPQANSKQNSRAQSESSGASANGKAEQRDMTALIDQAETLKASLREALAEITELARALKRHRKRAKIVESTLASLRELQTTDS